MGQSQSITSNPPVDDSEDESIGSGVRLAPELEANIIRDFQSKVLQEEWNKFGASVVTRRNERLQQLHDKHMEQQQQRQLASIARQQRMESLDTAIDQMQANLADQLVALDYDATKLIQKYGHWMNVEVDDPERDSKPLPCLGQRAHWIDCQKKYSSDSRPCNFYVQALEECVQRTIFGTTQESQKGTIDS